jgi:hypothetical protein
MARLTGDELLQFVEANTDHMDANELAIGAGYFSMVKTTDADGEPSERQQVNRSAFQNALLAAKGLSLFAPKATRSIGRKLSYRIATHPRTGNVVISGAYLRQIGIEPGQYIRVEPVDESKELVVLLHEDQTPRAEAEAEAEAPDGKKPKKPKKEVVVHDTTDELAAA